MPKHDYMKLKLSLVEARAEADLLKIQMHQCVVLVKGMFIRPFQTDFANFYCTSNTRKTWKKKELRKQGQLPCNLHTKVDQDSPPTIRPFLRVKIIKSYFYFSVSFLPCKLLYYCARSFLPNYARSFFL